MSSPNEKTKPKSIQKMKPRKIKCRSIAELCAIDNNNNKNNHNQVSALSARKLGPIKFYTDPNRQHSDDREDFVSKARQEEDHARSNGNSDLRRKKRSKAGARSSSQSFDRDGSQLKVKEILGHDHLVRDSDSSCHDDDDDDDNRMMSKVRYQSRSQVQALKLLMRRQKQLKQGLTDPKIPTISPSSTVAPNVTCKLKVRRSHYTSNTLVFFNVIFSHYN